MSKAAIALCPSLLLAGLSCGSPSDEIVGIQPARLDIEDALTTNGRIEAAGQAPVHAAVSGRVSRVYVEGGDAVEKGKVLLRLADEGSSNAREMALAQVQAARARVALYKDGLAPGAAASLEGERAKLEAARESVLEDRARLDRLVARGAAARSELDQASRTLKELETGIEAVTAQLEAPVQAARERELLSAVSEAEAALAEADRAISSLLIRAPRAGSLFSLPVREGDFVARGDLVARVGDLGTVRARILVDEPDLGRIALGATALLTADAYPGREWGCEVDRLATEIVELGARRVGEVLCSAANPDGALLPNLAVGVRVVTDRASGALSVPREAVRRMAGSASVWILQDGVAAQRSVELGVMGPVFVEVRKGLDGSETVLLAGTATISEGQRVQVLMEVNDAGM